MSKFGHAPFSPNRQKSLKTKLFLKRNTERRRLEKDMTRYKAMYVFTNTGIRAADMSDLLRTIKSTQWKKSRIWFGKVPSIRLAFENMAGTKRWPDLLQLRELIRGPCGLLLTDRDEEDVMEWFNTFAVWDYPHPGYEVDVTIKLDKGPLPQYTPVIEPFLREKGFPTTVVDGVVMLTSDFEVCRAGTQLKFEQIEQLWLLCEKLAVYQWKLKAKWTKEQGMVDLRDPEDEYGSYEIGMEGEFKSEHEEEEEGW